MTHNRLKRAAAGFTLVELGVVSAVIAILTIVVLVGRGMRDSSRVAAAAQLVNTLRDAGRAYATRYNNSRDFQKVSLANLESEPFLPPNVLDPWGGTPSVQPDKDVTYLDIEICVPTPELCQDLRDLLGKTTDANCGAAAAGSGTCANPVTVITR
jgi:type II secretory pathway pseudopilin PulG